MPERQRGRHQHVSRGDLGASIERGRRLRALEDRHVRAVARHACGEHEPCDRRVQAVLDTDLRQETLGLGDLPGQLGLSALPALDEGARISRERLAAADDLGSRLRLRHRLDGQLEPDSIRDLRAQLAFLLVHGPHEQEARGVGD